MFYFFFESRSNKKSDPLLLWMTGGPGCASELALFYENGPFQIVDNIDNLTLAWNDYGWDKVELLTVYPVLMTISTFIFLSSVSTHLTRESLYIHKKL